MSYSYSEDYTETVRLNDGTDALLRPIRPDDKPLLQNAFHRMSERSRYQRCMAEKLDLTEHELKYFTEVDGTDHFALGAIRTSDDSPSAGIGAGRFVRLIEPDVAEPAVTIVDGYQQRGLGKLILERLLGAAWEREIRWVHFELLANNLGMKRLIDAVSHHEVTFKNEGAGCVTARFPVPHPERIADDPDHVQQSSLYRVFAHIAAPHIEVTMRHRDTLPPPPP